MNIHRFPAPEWFGKDKGKTGIISKRVSVWVNFPVKNRKKNETKKKESKGRAFARSAEQILCAMIARLSYAERVFERGKHYTSFLYSVTTKRNHMFSNTSFAIY